MVEIISTFKSITDKIPSFIETARTFIISLSDKFHLPTDLHLMVFLLIALFVGYKFIKQFIAYSIFSKISTVLNWLALSFLLYICLAYL